MIKKCLKCNSEYSTSHTRQKYCSFKCRVESIPKGKNIIGNVYGKLTVIEELKPIMSKENIPSRNFLLLCVCGNKIERLHKSLHTTNPLSSCGCQMKFRKSGNASHRKSKTRLYKVWACIKQRCFNSKCPSYLKYGAVGISICDRWLNFQNFYEDLFQTYSDGLTLDRFPNQKGNYEPSNCRWATYKEQGRNVKSNRILKVGSYEKCVSEFNEVMGYPHGIVNGRLCLGWNDEESVLGREGCKYIGNYETIKNYYESTTNI